MQRPGPDAKRTVGTTQTGENQSGETNRQTPPLTPPISPPKTNNATIEDAISELRVEMRMAVYEERHLMGKKIRANAIEDRLNSITYPNNIRYPRDPKGLANFLAGYTYLFAGPKEEEPPTLEKFNWFINFVMHNYSNLPNGLDLKSFSDSDQDRIKITYELISKLQMAKDPFAQQLCRELKRNMPDNEHAVSFLSGLLHAGLPGHSYAPLRINEKFAPKNEESPWFQFSPQKLHQAIIEESGIKLTDADESYFMQGFEKIYDAAYHLHIAIIKFHEIESLNVSIRVKGNLAIIQGIQHLLETVEDVKERQKGYLNGCSCYHQTIKEEVSARIDKHLLGLITNLPAAIRSATKEVNHDILRARQRAQGIRIDWDLSDQPNPDPQDLQQGLAGNKAGGAVQAEPEKPYASTRGDFFAVQKNGDVRFDLRPPKFYRIYETRSARNENTSAHALELFQSSKSSILYLHDLDTFDSAKHVINAAIKMGFTKLIDKTELLPGGKFYKKNGLFLSGTEDECRELVKQIDEHNHNVKLRKKNQADFAVRLKVPFYEEKIVGNGSPPPSPEHKDSMGYMAVAGNSEGKQPLHRPAAGAPSLSVVVDEPESPVNLSPSLSPAHVDDEPGSPLNLSPLPSPANQARAHRSISRDVETGSPVARPPGAAFRFLTRSPHPGNVTEEKTPKAPPAKRPGGGGQGAA